MSRVILHTEKGDIRADARDGETLLSVIQKNGIRITAPCGGRGACGKCRVTVTKDGRNESVLACQTEVSGSIEVTVSARHGGIVESETETNVTADGVNGYGAAVDLGTTTIAVSLYNLESGELLGTKRGWNNQSSYGADVISRVQYINENGIETIKNTVVSQINEYISALLDENGIEKNGLVKIHVSGNTVMQHIYCGINPSGIAVYPYKPREYFRNFSFKSDMFKNAEITLSPCVSGYVGGDITRGLAHISDECKDKTILYLDIGTNGETALGRDGKFMCCSVATGPAFEGARLSCGMRRTDGAVNSVKHTDGIEYTVIGGGKPAGICGSAVIQLTALLTDAGIITESGRMRAPDDLDFMTDIDLGEDDDGNGIVYIDDEKSVFFTRGDVRKVQLAKASVAAGIKTLADAGNIGYDDIDTVYIAGGFGRYLDINSAVTIGMIPRELRNKVKYIGNASLKGTSDALLSEKAREKTEMIRNECEYTELSVSEKFRDEYIEQMPFYFGREE